MVAVPGTHSAARLVLAMRPQQAPVFGKVFVQRDYSSGTRCQFQTKFPAELENRVCSLAPRTYSEARAGGCPGKGREGRGSGLKPGRRVPRGSGSGLSKKGRWPQVYEGGPYAGPGWSSWNKAKPPGVMTLWNPAMPSAGTRYQPPSSPGADPPTPGC